jgi:hypothetical protein
MNLNLKYNCNLILKLIIIFTVVYSTLEIIPSNDIILKEKILIFFIVLTSFFIINNYLK